MTILSNSFSDDRYWVINTPKSPLIQQVSSAILGQSPYRYLYRSIRMRGLDGEIELLLEILPWLLLADRLL